MKFLTISNILAAFTIRKPTDEKGNEVAPEARFTSGLTRYAPGLVLTHCFS